MYPKIFRIKFIFLVLCFVHVQPQEMSTLTILGREFKKSEIQHLRGLFPSSLDQKFSNIPWILKSSQQGNCPAQPSYSLNKEGEKCGSLFLDCESPMICDSGICRNPVYDDIGKNCTFSCRSPFVVFNLVCIKGVCNYYRKEGEKCKSKDECYSEQCVSGKCVDKKFNETCTTTEQCLFPNLYCKQGKCSNRIEENQRCSDSQECKIGLGCSNGKCTYVDSFSNCKSKNPLELALTEIFTGFVCYPDNILRKKYLSKKGDRCLYGFHCSEGLACTKDGLCEDAGFVQCSNYTLPYSTQWNRTSPSCSGMYCDCKNPTTPVCPAKIDPFSKIFDCYSNYLYDVQNCTSLECGPSSQITDSENCAFKKCRSILDKYHCCWNKYYPGSFKVPTSGLGDYKFDPSICINISRSLISKPSLKLILIFMFLVLFSF